MKNRTTARLFITAPSTGESTRVTGSKTLAVPNPICRSSNWPAMPNAAKAAYTPNAMTMPSPTSSRPAQTKPPSDDGTVGADAGIPAQNRPARTRLRMARKAGGPLNPDSKGVMKNNTPKRIQSRAAAAAHA